MPSLRASSMTAATSLLRNGHWTRRSTRAERAPGSLVFTPTSGRVDLTNWRLWWRWEPGADWRTPLGPEGPTWQDRQQHPVVQVSYVDALAYAAWAGRRLLTEAEVEFATRGGLCGAEFAWGDEFLPNGELMANTWQGEFPFNNQGALGWQGTAPVGTFPANGYGLYDMIGNVWQWTTSLFTADHRATALSANNHGVDEVGRSAGEGKCNCGSGSAPARTGVNQNSADAWTQVIRSPDSSVRRVTKGGSHLCAPEYCQRYRPAARSPQTEDSATSHIGFRCALG